MKVFITKYALSKAGIFEIEAEQCSESMVRWKTEYLSEYAHGEGRQWHRTRESAIARAEEMRLNKIASLKKALKRIEEIKF